MSVLGSIVGKLVKPVSDIIKEAVPDKDLAAKLDNQIQTLLIEKSTQLLDAQKSIIVAEAQSESWLTRNWRPTTMLVLVGCVLAHWLGLTPENLSPEEVTHLLDIVQIGLGGYVVSRGAEKCVKAYKK